MDKKTLIWNEFWERQNEDDYSLEENFKWLFEKWDEICELFQKETLFSFFENLFFKFCRENMECSENGLQILLAIQISSSIDEIDKKLESFSKGKDLKDKDKKPESLIIKNFSWNYMIKKFFRGKIVNYFKEFNRKGKNKKLEYSNSKKISWDCMMREFFKKKIIKCDKAFNPDDFYKIIEKSILLELNIVRIKNNLKKLSFCKLETRVLYSDYFELHFSFGKAKLKEIVEKIVKNNNFLHSEVSQFKIKTVLKDSFLKCSINYYK